MYIFITFFCVYSIFVFLEGWGAWNDQNKFRGLAHLSSRALRARPGRRARRGSGARPGRGPVFAARSGAPVPIREGSRRGMPMNYERERGRERGRERESLRERERKRATAKCQKSILKR